MFITLEKRIFIWSVYLMETETIKTQSYNLVGDIGGTNARFALVVPGE